MMYADRPSDPTPRITQVELLAMPCPPHAYDYEGLRAVDVDYVECKIHAKFVCADCYNCNKCLDCEHIRQLWVWRCVKCQHEDVEDIGPF